MIFDHMKKTFALLAAVAAICLVAYAGTTTLLGTLITVNNTTSNTVAVVSGTVPAPRGTFVVAHNGLTATNALVCTEQLSIDNTNWITVNTFTFAATNATAQSFLGGNYTNRTIYTRLAITTTNSVDVGVSYVQP